MNIEVLFPEIANLYGELANIKFLVDGNKTYNVISSSLGREPAFVRKNPDFLYMGAMTEKSQEFVINNLMPYRDKLWELIQNGTFILLTGNSGEVFLNEILDEDNNLSIEGLGLIKGMAKRRMMHRHNSLYLGKCNIDGVERTDIVAFKSQFTSTVYGEDYMPLFSTTRGFGRGLIDGSEEGIRLNNFMCTDLLGPLLILNPYFTKGLLSAMGEKNPNLPFFDVAIDVYERRLKEFNEPDRGFTY